MHQGSFRVTLMEVKGMIKVYEMIEKKSRKNENQSKKRLVIEQLQLLKKAWGHRSKIEITQCLK
jgi:hypothetical protein